MRKYLIILAVILLTCACNDDRQRVAFTNIDSICLQVGGTLQFNYQAPTCQLGFSRSKKQFRAHSDNMSDYVIADFSSIPVNLGETVQCDITWTTETDILKRNNLTLEVVRIEGEDMWLWSDSGRIGLSIRILE